MAPAGGVRQARQRRAAPRAAPARSDSVRSAARSLAERARGLRAVSASPGRTGPLVTRRKLRHGLAPGAPGRWREPCAARPLRAAKNCLTIRSSSEWNVTTASRPPGLSTRSAAWSARTSSPSSSLTAIRRPWNVRVAGWMWLPGSTRTTPATRSASCAVVSIRPRRRASMDGAGHGPRAPLLAVMVDDVGEHRLVGLVDEVGGARAVGAHAHVEGAVVAEREAALRLVELHRRDADIEHHPVDLRHAGLGQEGVEVAEAARHEAQAPSGLRDQGLPARDGRWDRGRSPTTCRAGIGAPAARACSRRPRRCRRRRCRPRVRRLSTTSSSRTGTCGWADDPAAGPAPAGSPDDGRRRIMGGPPRWRDPGRSVGARRKPGRECGWCVS